MPFVSEMFLNFKPDHSDAASFRIRGRILEKNDFLLFIGKRMEHFFKLVSLLNGLLHRRGSFARFTLGQDTQ